MGRKLHAPAINVGDYDITEQRTGFYCRNTLDGRVHGPFATLVEALDRAEGTEPQEEEIDDGGFDGLRGLRGAEGELDGYALGIEA